MCAIRSNKYERLSYAEKHNAESERKENQERLQELIMLRRKIYPYKREEYIDEYNELTEEINILRKRNKKLYNHLINCKISKHNGCYGENGVCYKMYGKSAKELTSEQRREYNRLMKAKERANKK